MGYVGTSCGFIRVKMGSISLHQVFETVEMLFKNRSALRAS